MNRVNLFYHFLYRGFVNFTSVLRSFTQNKEKTQPGFRNSGVNLFRRAIRARQQNEPRGPYTDRVVSLRAVKSYFIGNEQDYNFIREVCDREGVEFTRTYFRSAWDCYGGANLAEK